MADDDPALGEQVLHVAEAGMEAKVQPHGVSNHLWGEAMADMYVGTWWHHGAGITITKFEGSPDGGSAIAQWRTYTWCQDPTTKKPNPPPCDTSLGNFIEDGAIASIALFHPAGQHDHTLSGLVVATSDPIGGFGKWGADVQFTMLPGNMLLVDTGSGSTMFCGDNTDPSLYPPYPCGA